jgi:hypothetical protein
MKNIQTKYKLNFKTMKKGLLTLLAASLVFVGCQNYDDQFDDLNAQISALKSQVDGLSSLSGQVASLSGSISGLQAGVTAAQNAASAANTAASAIDLSGLSASLATLQAEVDAVQASLASAATATAVAALQAEIDAIEADVDELLATSNVYNAGLSITTPAQLDAAVALGNNINIVNGSVTITHSSTMSATKLQGVVDKIFTVTGTYNYTAAANTVAPPTFDKLASTGDLTVKAAGDISMKALQTAGTITLDDSFTTKVTSIDLGALTSVTAFQTDSSSNVDEINFASVMNLDLGSLPYYANAATNKFDVDLKKGATLDIASLDDVNAAGSSKDYTLVLDGPAEVNISNMVSDEGAITLTDVGTATISGFKGLITVGSGTKNVVFTDTQRVALSSATSLETVSIDVDLVDDADLSSTAKAKYAYAGGARSGSTPSLTFSSMTNLTSVALTGTFNDLTFTSLTNLTSIDIDAKFDALSVTGNANLTSFDVTGSEFSDVTFTGNTGITTVEFDHTTDLTMTGSTTADGEADVTITGNTEMTSLTFSATKLSTLAVTGNTKLATVNFTGLSTVGSDAPNVDIWNNALTATASDTDDGTTQYNAGTTAATNTNAKLDLGSYTTSSGMNTLKAYMDALVADADSDAVVKFDTVTDYVIASGAVGNSNGKTAGTTLSVSSSGDATKENKITTVLELTKAEAANGKTAKSEKKAYILDGLAAGGGQVQFTLGGSDKLFDTTTNGSGSDVTLNGNLELDKATLGSTINTTRASAYGVTMEVKRGGNSYQTISLIQYPSGQATGTVFGERYTTANATGAAVSSTNYGFGIDDKLILTIGSNSVSAIPGTGGATTLTGLADDLVSAYETKYGSGGTASASAVATVSNSSGVLTITMLQEDSGGYAQTISLAVSAGATTATNAANIDYFIGATSQSGDNATRDTDLIVTFESTAAGAEESTIPAITSSVSNDSKVTVVTLSNTVVSNSTDSNAGTYTRAQEPQTDLRAGEDLVSSTAAARIVRYRAH